MKKSSVIFERSGGQIYSRIIGSSDRRPLPNKLEMDGKITSVDLAHKVNIQVSKLIDEIIDKQKNEKGK